MPPTIDLFRQALDHYRAGRFDIALPVAQQAFDAEPDDPESHNLLGVCLISTEKAASGFEVLKAAVQRWPSHVSLLTNLAISLHNAGENKAAAHYFRRLAVVQPDNPLAYDRLCLIDLTWRGDRTGAVLMADRAARLAPQDEGIRVNQALAWAAHDLRRASQTFEIVTALSPQSPYGYVQQAGLQMRMCRPAVALDYLRRALRLDPNDDDAIKHALRCRHYHQASRAAAGLGSAPGEGIVLRGPFSTASGYAHMGRRYIQTLRKQNVPLHVIGIFGHETWAAEPLDRPVPAKAVVNMMVPLAVEPVHGMTNILYSMFEGPRISPTWAQQSLNSDMVIVPTESSKLAWASRGYPEDRLRVCPLGVDAEPDTADAPPLVLVSGNGRRVDTYRHRFLNVSDAIPRKNLDGLLRVWLRATQRSDDAVLILKPGKGGNAKALAELQDIVRRTQAHVGKSFADAAPIVLVDQPLSEAEMTGLFRASTIYWSLSHGEGWDLPLSKAGAMGLGLIAPRHSAYVDYLDDRFARMIPCTIGPAHRPYSRDPWEPFFNLDWWEPDEDAAASIITDIIRGRDAALPDASRHLLENFTWDQATHTLRRILADAGLLRNSGMAR